MAKVIKYDDTSGIESDFKQAPVGLYRLKCEEISQRTSNNNEEMVEVVFRPTHDANGKKLKETYGRLWYYAPLDPDADWARRLKELVTAFGLKSKGGNIAAIEGKSCLGRLREDTDLNGEYRPNIGKLMAMPDEVEEEADEDESEDETEDGALDEMSRAELKAYIKENGLEISVKKSMSDEDIVTAIQELEEADEEEDEEDEDEEDEEPEAEADEDEDEAEDEDNYDDMTIKELRQELEDRELETKGARKVLVARLRTDDVSEPV